MPGSYKKNIPPAARSPVKPLIEPRLEDQYWWERNGTFNPGVTEYKDHVLLLYRAYDDFRISRLGMATSKDGITFTRYAHPAVDTDPNDPDERLGIEDPRITKIDDTYYIVHTSAAYHVVGSASDISGIKDFLPWRIRISMHSTTDFKRYVHHDVILPDVPAKNGCLLPVKINGTFALLYRQYKQLIITYTEDFEHWFNTQNVDWPPPEPWYSTKLGLGAPPLLTDAGYLLVYHGVDATNVYRLGLMMLDRDDPTKLLWYSEPILEPEMPYEKQGYIPNVVYCCGALIRESELWIYYGAADKVIGRAVLPLKDILNGAA